VHRRRRSYRLFSEFRGHAVHVTWVLPAQLVLIMGVPMKLKQHLLASALCVLPFAASAADLPMKAPPMRVVQPIPFTWTGFYVGASGGMIAQNSVFTDTGLGGGGGLIFSAGDQYGVSGTGGILGANIGYNYQFAPNWVLGLEADIAWTSISNSYSFNCRSGGVCSSVGSKLNSIGTFRGRIGYAWDRALFYATGGLAYGHVQNTASWDQTPGGTSANDTWRTGWTVGGGLEYAFLNNWTVRAEALYVDLGNSTGSVSTTFGCAFGFKNKYTLGRFGLNYKF
jgi:outer membrane immunogenic protein